MPGHVARIGIRGPQVDGSTCETRSVLAHNRIEVMHGVNLDQLGRRDAGHYGGLTYDQLEQRITEEAQAIGLQVRFFQTNHEGEFVEHLHRLESLADGLIVNPGAWTHYSWAIRDALEIAGAADRRGAPLRRAGARGVPPRLGRLATSAWRP